MPSRRRCRQCALSEATVTNANAQRSVDPYTKILVQARAEHERLCYTHNSGVYEYLLLVPLIFEQTLQKKEVATVAQCPEIVRVPAGQHALRNSDLGHNTFGNRPGPKLISIFQQ